MKERKKDVPAWAVKFLHLICPQHLMEEIEGDLMQRFRCDADRYQVSKARRRFIWNVLCFFRPGILLRNKFHFEPMYFIMYWSYFKIAFRHLLRYKVFTIINVSGLTIGITSFFLVLQYASFELNYDHFHGNVDEIYRIATKQKGGGDFENASARNFAGINELLKDSFHEIKVSTLFIKRPANTGFLFSLDNKIHNEPGNILEADTAFFEVFPSLLERGDAAAVLSDPHGIVLSASMAKKLFGSADPVGKQLQRVDDHSNGWNYVITGIMRDIPLNSHLHANFVKPIVREEWRNLDPWRAPVAYSYITIDTRYSHHLVEEKLNTIVKNAALANPQLKDVQFMVQPMADIHLHSHLKDEFEVNGNSQLVYIILLIGSIILITAWINYVNIESARFTKNIREIGVRRIIGSDRISLCFQFLVRYVIIAFIAVIVSVVLTGLLLPGLKAYIGLPMAELQLGTPAVWAMALSLFFLGSFLTGIYPGLALLRFKLVNALKGQIGEVRRSQVFRRSLVVIQFSVCVVLIAFLMVIHRQLDLMLSADRNMEIDQVISINNPTAYMREGEKNVHEFNALRDNFLLNPAIKSVSSSSAVPGAEIGFTYVDLIKRNIGDPSDPTRYKMLFIDYNFIPTFGLKLTAGRNYSENNSEDENWQTLIINESAAKALGFSFGNEALYQEVYLNLVGEWTKYKIIGVIKDYHHEAVKKDIHPTIFFLNHNIGQQVYYSVRFDAGTNPQELISFLQRKWKQVFPEKPFEYFFLDDYYGQQFKSELYFRRMFSLFSGVVIVIACLGVLGMTIFEASSRLKEISVRKVLGASVREIVTLLYKRHLKLLAISALIGYPVMIYCSSAWLSFYPVRIGLPWWIFVVPVAGILMLLVLATGYQVFKAATTNPAEHLKYE